MLFFPVWIQIRVALYKTHSRLLGRHGGVTHKEQVLVRLLINNRLIEMARRSEANIPNAKNIQSTFIFTSELFVTEIV